MRGEGVDGQREHGGFGAARPLRAACNAGHLSIDIGPNPQNAAGHPCDLDATRGLWVMTACGHSLLCYQECPSGWAVVSGEEPVWGDRREGLCANPPISLFTYSCSKNDALLSRTLETYIFLFTNVTLINLIKK